MSRLGLVSAGEANVSVSVSGGERLGLFSVSSFYVSWPSLEIVPKGTFPSVELKTRGVTEYSDCGPIERSISETVQDRS